jgi:hypothetical protein
MLQPCYVLAGALKSRECNTGTRNSEVHMRNATVGVGSGLGLWLGLGLAIYQPNPNPTPNLLLARGFAPEPPARVRYARIQKCTLACALHFTSELRHRDTICSVLRQTQYSEISLIVKLANSYDVESDGNANDFTLFLVT